jgi:hypothetical protein
VRELFERASVKVGYSNYRSASETAKKLISNLNDKKTSDIKSATFIFQNSESKRYKRHLKRYI